MDEDAALIRASGKDPDKFREIFSRHYAFIHGFVTRRYGPDLADDVASETFLQAFARRGSYDSAYPDARPWLVGIARNLTMNRLRKEARQRDIARRLWWVSSGESSTTEVPDQVYEALSGLSEGELDVLLLIGWEDLTYEQAAKALGIAVGTVRSRLHRARASVREVLQRAEDARRSE